MTGMWILLAVSAWAIYRLGCWVDERGQATNHENGSDHA